MVIGKNSYKDEIQPKHIAPNPTKRTMDIGYFSSVRRVLNLDTTEVIGDISKLMVCGDRIYILDRKSKTFFCFDENGKLLWKFDKIGDGPYELPEITDFHVRKDIYLFANVRGKLLKLDSLGTALSYQYLGNPQKLFFPNYLFVDPRGAYILGLEDMGDFDYFPYEMAVLDSIDLQVRSAHISKSNDPPVKRWNAESYPIHVFSNNEGFYYTDVFNDTIYTYENGVFNRQYFIDFGSYKVPQKIKRNPKYTLNHFFKSNFAGNIQEVFATDSLLTFTYLIGGVPNYVFINKSNAEISESAVRWMQIGPLMSQIKFIGSSGNQLILKIEPYDLIRAYKFGKKSFEKLTWEEYELKISDIYPEYYKLYKSVSAVSNPILIFVEFNSKKIFEHV